MGPTLNPKLDHSHTSTLLLSLYESMTTLNCFGYNQTSEYYSLCSLATKEKKKEITLHNIICVLQCKDRD